jgi:cytochrome c oxidase cbb3-type subunit 3
MQTRSTQTKSTRCAGIDSPAPDESRSLSCGLSPVSTLIVLALVWGSFPAGQLWAQSRGNAKPAGDSAALEGKQSFESICAACHGLDGRGGERGPDIARRREIQRLPDSALLRIVRQGVPGKGMPAFASLTALQVQAVVRHLRILQGLGAAAKMPGDPERGKALFFGQSGCSQCHMVNGEGGFIGSDLSSYASAQPPAEIRRAITDPNRNLDPRKRTVVVTTQDGQTQTGIARNEDNFSLQLQTVDGAFHFFSKADLRNIEYQPGSLMPGDYGSRLSPREIDDLVSFLMSAARKH